MDEKIVKEWYTQRLIAAGYRVVSFSETTKVVVVDAFGGSQWYSSLQAAAMKLAMA